MARRTKEQIQGAAAKLAQFPERHPTVGDWNLRQFVVAPYVILYEVVDGAVVIARVLHASRDLGKVVVEPGVEDT